MERKDVEKLADLVRIKVSEAEIDEFLASMDSILAYVGELQSITTQKYAPQPGDVYNVMRDDTNPRPAGEVAEDILAGAPALKDGFLKVKQIL